MEGNDTAYSPAKKELSRGALALQEKTASGTITLGLRQQEYLNCQQSTAADKPLRLIHVGGSKHYDKAVDHLTRITVTIGDQVKDTTIGTNGPFPEFDHAQLLELAAARMPFGKYRGRRLVELPEPYVVWFAGQGFPPGKLGEMLQTVYEIKVNGLEYLFDKL
jgi:uncharacterized protein (DUF3820 family)